MVSLTMVRYVVINANPTPVEICDQYRPHAVFEKKLHIVASFVIFNHL